MPGNNQAWQSSQQRQTEWIGQGFDLSYYSATPRLLAMISISTCQRNVSLMTIDIV